MSGNKYGVASRILQDAETAVSEGVQKHGDTAKSFQMIGQMWQTYLANMVASRNSPKITPFDVAQMMILVKTCRAMYGFSMDNHIDIAGYSALAGMLNPMGDIDEEFDRIVNDGVQNGKPV